MRKGCTSTGQEDFKYCRSSSEMSGSSSSNLLGYVSINKQKYKTTQHNNKTIKKAKMKITINCVHLHCISNSHKKMLEATSQGHEINYFGGKTFLKKKTRRQNNYDVASLGVSGDT